MLKCLDTFNNIDTLGGDSISFEDDFQFPEEGNPEVNERYESMMNMFLLSMSLMFKSSSILTNFLKYLFCFTLFVKAYS